MKQDQDCSIAGRALDALNSLTAQDEEIQRLKEQRAQAKKDMIEELGQMLRQAPLDQTFALASDDYWADPLLADVMKKAYVLATGKGGLDSSRLSGIGGLLGAQTPEEGDAARQKEKSNGGFCFRDAHCGSQTAHFL